MAAHAHAFNDGNPLAERRTRWAVLLTAAMMIVEVVAGWLSNSMALLADGWHMSSHTLALSLALLAYAAARHLAQDRRFAFGTWKIEVLGGYTSAILLLMVASSMIWQSVERLRAPTAIYYDEAIAVAVIGLVVNLICAKLLHAGHGRGRDHGSGHHGDADLNLRSAYAHVLADAATSMLAIVALFGGRFWSASWLDPVIGIVGAILVAVWAWGVLKATGKVLLDAEMDAPVVEEIRDVIAATPARLSDLHVWRVAEKKYACIVGLDAVPPAAPEDFKRALAVHEELVHVTVEINPLPSA